MKQPLSHEAAFAELDAVAFDLLDSVERNAIMAHVAGCSICRAELDSLQGTAADLAFATPSTQHVAVVSRERVRERLRARGSAESQMPKPVPTPLVFPRVPTPPNGLAGMGERRSTPSYVIAAGILFAASLAAFAFSLRNEEQTSDLRSRVVAGEAARRTADSLAFQLAARDSLLAGIAGRDVTVMTLTSQAAKDPYGRMFWDRARHTWTLIAHNMPVLNGGRAYQLWLVTPKAKVSAGTFTARNGDAVVRATFDLNDPLTAVAVTEEPAGGVAQPTGTVVIAAQGR
jgi:hypothetical protein